jgi:hypothetical protein
MPTSPSSMVRTWLSLRHSLAGEAGMVLELCAYTRVARIRRRAELERPERRLLERQIKEL